MWPELQLGFSDNDTVFKYGMSFLCFSTLKTSRRHSLSAFSFVCDIFFVLILFQIIRLREFLDHYAGMVIKEFLCVVIEKFPLYTLLCYRSQGNLRHVSVIDIWEIENTFHYQCLETVVTFPDCQYNNPFKFCSEIAN